MDRKSGTALAHYTLLEKIGAGGMGDVFRATDTKLGRDVAIKMLPDEVAANPERLTRFRREAQLLASLNHANIAAIHGIEEAGGTPFLVLEMIEGEDLAQRMARGPVSVDEALGIALQTAEGLDEAHEHGIIHRDLKPANIKITPSGKVKILDFGLGKAYEMSPSEPGNPSLSPTLTAAATRAGVIMGTAAYMSPEQARGAAVDKRADIWAFGCVMLEMLSGQRTFAGDTISDTLAAVLKSDPDWSSLPAGTHPALRRLLIRCLEKDPRKRLRDIGEARLALEAILSGAPEEEPGEGAGPAPRPRRGNALLLAGAVAVTAVLTAGTTVLLRPEAEEPALRKYEVPAPGVLLDENTVPVLSPDGSRILYDTAEGLWIRDLGDLEPRLLAGTAQASHPVWSPDGAFVAYFAEGNIWKIPVQGGQAASIAVGISHIEDSGSISWGTPDRIIYAQGDGGVFQVPSRGGEPRAIAEPDMTEVQDIHQVHALPDGRGVLYVAHRTRHTYDTIVLRTEGKSWNLLQFEDDEIRTPIYASTGHILYRRQTGNAGLWAVPFSLPDLEITGEPFLVAREGSLPSAASDGSLLYALNTGSTPRQLVWFDRQGNEVGTLGAPATRLQSPAISPDGQRVALMAQEGESRDIWVHDIERGTRLRLTFNPQGDWDPAWSPDGENILFWEGATRAISMKPSDGTGSVQRVVKEEFLDSGLPTVTPDGKSLLFWVRNAETKGDIYTMPLDGDGGPAPFLRSAFAEEDPTLSPQGDYVAYVSDETGRSEIYLTRFPGAEGKWQVSDSGGLNPRWGPRGDRIYYLQERDFMEVEMSTGTVPSLGTPRRLFTLPWLDPDAFWSNRYAIALDGERFLISKELKDGSEEARMVLVRNWIREFSDQP